MVKVCVLAYSILGQRVLSSHFSLDKHPHSSLRGWSKPSLWGYSSMSLEYPKINTWTESILGKFLIPLLYEGLFLIYKGLFSFISLWRPLLFSFSMKVYLWDCSFLVYEGLFLIVPNHDPPFRTQKHRSLLHQTKSFFNCVTSNNHHPWSSLM